MKPDGGAAFPRPASETKYRGFADQRGMSYREYLISQILPALINNVRGAALREGILRAYPNTEEEKVDDIFRMLLAKEASQIADAVITLLEEERENG